MSMVKSKLAFLQVEEKLNTSKNH